MCERKKNGLRLNAKRKKIVWETKIKKVKKWSEKLKCKKKKVKMGKILMLQ